ncbi:MAG: hypothetical protein ACRYGK_18235 [Janthinobacterium lividum]
MDKAAGTNRSFPRTVSGTGKQVKASWVDYDQSMKELINELSVRNGPMTMIDNLLFLVDPDRDQPGTDFQSRLLTCLDSLKADEKPTYGHPSDSDLFISVVEGRLLDALHLPRFLAIQYPRTPLPRDKAPPNLMELQREWLMQCRLGLTVTQAHPARTKLETLHQLSYAWGSGKNPSDINDGFGRTMDKEKKIFLEPMDAHKKKDGMIFFNNGVRNCLIAHTQEHFQVAYRKIVDDDKLPYDQKKKAVLKLIYKEIGNLEALRRENTPGQETRPIKALDKMLGVTKDESVDKFHHRKQKEVQSHLQDLINLYVGEKSTQSFLAQRIFRFFLPKGTGRPYLLDRLNDKDDPLRSQVIKASQVIIAKMDDKEKMALKRRIEKLGNIAAHGSGYEKAEPLDVMYIVLDEINNYFGLAQTSSSSNPSVGGA